MSTVIIVILIVVISEVAYLIIQNLVQNHVLNAYTKAIESRDLEAALEALDTKTARFFIPRFNLDYMRFNAYQFANDVENSSRVLDTLLTANTSKKQRADIVVRAFYFYLEQDRKDDAKQMLQEIQATGDAATAKRCTLAWETLGEGDSSKIDELAAEYEASKNKLDRVNLAMLIAAQYSNKGDLESAKAWTDKVGAMTKRQE